MLSGTGSFESISLVRPPDRNRLIRGHLDGTVNLAPTGSSLEPKYCRGDGAWAFTRGDAKQIARYGHIGLDSAAIKLVPVMTTETFFLDAEYSGDHRLGCALGGHLIDVSSC